MVRVIPEPLDVVRRALGRVLDPLLAEHLRGDSPVLGPGCALSSADAIALADAVRQVARESDADCVLEDEDLGVGNGPITLDRAAESVARRWAGDR